MGLGFVVATMLVVWAVPVMLHAAAWWEIAVCAGITIALFGIGGCSFWVIDEWRERSKRRTESDTLMADVEMMLHDEEQGCTGHRQRGEL
jgi:hypothetical protein